MYWLREHYISEKPRFSFFREIRTLAIFFVVIFVGVLIFTNLNLFASSFASFFTEEAQPIDPIYTTQISQNNDIASIISTSQEQHDEIEWLVKKYQTTAMDANTLTSSPEEYLQSQLKDYDFTFNTLPPVNRILVPSIGLDVPIVIPTDMSPKDFAKGNFEKELNEWIVKYPTTPEPGQEGNALLFGHSSYEVWKTNPYGMIFKDIPKLKDGMLIQVLRKGNLYEYKVVDLFVVPPKQVNAQYMTYQNIWGSYITLMWCYPLGTDNKRIMVVAKLIEK